MDDQDTENNVGEETSDFHNEAPLFHFQFWKLLRAYKLFKTMLSFV